MLSATNPIHDKSVILITVMAWYHQASSHYVNLLLTKISETKWYQNATTSTATCLHGKGKLCGRGYYTKYCQTSNIKRTIVSSKIVDHSDVVGAAPTGDAPTTSEWYCLLWCILYHSDVVGASPVGAAPTTSSFFTKTPGFNGLGGDNCKTRWEIFKCWDLVTLY